MGLEEAGLRGIRHCQYDPSDTAFPKQGGGGGVGTTIERRVKWRSRSAPQYPLTPHPTPQHPTPMYFCICFCIYFCLYFCAQTLLIKSFEKSVQIWTFPKIFLRRTSPADDASDSSEPTASIRRGQSATVCSGATRWVAMPLIPLSVPLPTGSPPPVALG